jgi:hypothetical protein
MVSANSKVSWGEQRVEKRQSLPIRRETTEQADVTSLTRSSKLCSTVDTP